MPSRDIYFTFGASTWSHDPDESDQKYDPINPPAYATGYWKARAKEGNGWSTVTSESFGVAPTDYIHYYPLTADFNDHAGTNHITSTATITASGASVNGVGQMLILTSTIELLNYTVSLYFTMSSGENNRAIICSPDNNYGIALFDNGMLRHYLNGRAADPPAIPLLVSTTYHIVITKKLNTHYKWYVNNVESEETTEPGIDIKGFGGIFGFDGYECRGIYKDIKIFDKVLTRDEINLL